MNKKILAILLSLAMPGSAVNFPVFAENDETEAAEVTVASEVTDATEETESDAEAEEALAIAGEVTEVASGTCGVEENKDNVTWLLDSEGTLTVSGTGDMANEYYPWLDYRDQITKVIVTDGVTRVGSHAFSYYKYISSGNQPRYYYPNLRTLILSDSVQSIGAEAFRGSGLLNVELGNGLVTIEDGAFCVCSLLQSVNLPDTLKTIRNYVFEDCSSLKEVDIPDSVTSLGNYLFRSCIALESVKLPNKIITVPESSFQNCVNLISIGIPANVSVIGNYAFSGCTKLETANIPVYVRAIGSYAFSGCSALTNITIPNHVKAIGDHAFENCVSAESITLGNDVRTIEPYAFDGDVNVKTLYLPEYLTSVGDRAFYNNSSLEKIYFAGSAEQWNNISVGANNMYFSFCEDIEYNSDYYWEDVIPEEPTDAEIIASGTCGSEGSNVKWSLDDYGKLTISGKWDMADEYSPWLDYRDQITKVIVTDGVTKVGNHAFSYYKYISSGNQPRYYYPNLRTLILSDSVQSIGAEAFRGSGLLNVELGNGLTSIEAGAFCVCSLLQSVNLPDTLKTIGNNVFDTCSSLREAEIPDSVTSIGNYLFSGCTSLESVKLPNKIITVPEYIFFGCVNLVSIDIPSNVSVIGDYAFSGCSKLETANIPESVTSIGGYAFNGCSKLKSVNIPESVTSIGEYAFNGCSKLGSITVPDYVTSIPAYAFSECSELERVIIGENTASIGYSAFYNDAKLSGLYIPVKVTSIGSNAFYNAESLEKIYYGGTEEQWNAINIGSNNNYLKYAEVIYGASPEDVPEVVQPTPTAEPTTAPTATPTATPTTAPTATPTAVPTEAPTSAPTTAPTATPTVPPATDGAKIKVSSAKVAPGKTVSVTVELSENKGFANLGLQIGFDASALTLISVSNNTSVGATYTGAQSITVNPYNMGWDSTSNNTYNGTLATLTFEVNDDAPDGTYPISVSYYRGKNGNYSDGEDVNYDEDFKPLNLNYTNGAITVSRHIPGDINGDGKVNNQDGTFLLRHLAGWNVSVDETALDITGDDKVNNQDGTILLRYLAGWSVTIN
ncbi:MAG: leucine-rich repeat protein [Clostridia bacterium]|nr:leucine-rich repeat protein [Clostridia bacterium]